MKKQLLFGSALLLSISAYSQSANRQLFQGAKLVEDKRFENRFVKQNMDMPIPSTANKPIGPVQTEANPTSSNINASSSSAPILNTTFYRISGSGNVFGMLVSASKPLNYHRIIETVSFIQRKSPTYTVSPLGDGNVGTIVAYTAKNDAAANNVSAWDSTCIWAEPTNQGRYPVGGIWNPGGFTNANGDPNNARVVGMGPVTTGSGWVGSWYASKSLTATPKNVPSSDEQFIPNVSPFNSSTSPTMTKHDFPRYGFNVVTGAIWVAGQKQNDVNGTTNAAYGLRGAALVKGTFVTGAMVWTQDSIIPLTEMRTDGSKLLSEPYLKFTPDGIVGYAMFLGMRQGVAAGSNNRGLQPIVYKTTNSGASWNLVNSIDFSQTTPEFTRIKNTIRSVGGVTPQVEAPWFWSEGIDMTIDKNNKLHILSTCIGHASSHVDSMNYLSRWTIGTEDYHWPHVNTARPLIVDYSGDGTTGWDALIIDSLITEGPSSTSGEPGFNFNVWGSPTANESVSSDSRLQITRDYTGEYLAYSWAESDTNITTNSVKWNEFPNIKVRALRVCDNALSPDDISITSTTLTLNAVKDKAYFHYMSGEMKAGSATATSATLAIPFTVSSNPNTEGINPVNNYFAMSHLLFNFVNNPACVSSVGVPSIKNDATESTVFPNPTENNFNVRLTLSQSNDISIAVYNALGQKVAETKANGTVGENNVPMNMNNANAGVYFVKIKVGKSETTKKLVVE